MPLLNKNIILELEKNGCKFSSCTNLRGEFAFVKPCVVEGGSYIYHLILGAYGYIGSCSWLQDIIIGHYSVISNNVIGVIGQHSLNTLSSSPHISDIINHQNTTISADDNSFLKIGNDVLVKQHTSFLQKINIGHGAVIEEGSIISKDIPPYSIVAGVNKIIGQRFSDELISDLLECKWWQYDIPSLQSQGLPVPWKNPYDLIQFLHDQDPKSLPLIPNIAQSVSISDTILELTSFPWHSQ